MRVAHTGRKQICHEAQNCTCVTTGDDVPIQSSESAPTSAGDQEYSICIINAAEPNTAVPDVVNIDVDGKVRQCGTDACGNGGVRQRTIARSLGEVDSADCSPIPNLVAPTR